MQALRESNEITHVMIKEQFNDMKKFKKEDNNRKGE